MTAAAAPSVRRPGRRALFPEALPDPEGEAAAAIASLRFTVTLADRSKTIDLTMLAGRKALARTFAGALWRACQVGGPAGSISTAYAYANALKTFWRYLDSAGSHVARLSDVSAVCIDGFDSWMEGSGLHPNHRLHRMSKVLNLLRLAEAAEPSHLPPDASRRLMYTSDRPGVRARPRDAYGDDVAAALRKAARTDLAAIIRRLGEADRIPAVEDSDRSKALAATHKQVMEVIDAEGVIGHRHPLFKRLYTLRRESGLPNDRLIHDLHGRRHLIAADLVPLIVLISLDTGMEIEAIKGLRADCLKNPAGGYVEIAATAGLIAPGQRLRRIDAAQRTPRNGPGKIRAIEGLRCGRSPVFRPDIPGMAQHRRGQQAQGDLLPLRQQDVRRLPGISNRHRRPGSAEAIQPLGHHRLHHGPGKGPLRRVGEGASIHLQFPAGRGSIPLPHALHHRGEQGLIAGGAVVRINGDMGAGRRRRRGCIRPPQRLQGIGKPRGFPVRGEQPRPVTDHRPGPFRDGQGITELKLIVLLFRHQRQRQGRQQPLPVR